MFQVGVREEPAKTGEFDRYSLFYYFSVPIPTIRTYLYRMTDLPPRADSEIKKEGC